MNIIFANNYSINSISKANENEKTIENFSLKNTDEKIISLADYQDAKGFVIVFTCNHCPFAKLYPNRFNKLNSKYSKQGIYLIAISSTDTMLYEEDNFDQMKIKAKKEKFNFPYLFDENQTVAKMFAPDKTPHAFVVWKENGKYLIKYNGAFDDNGAEENKVKNHYVEDAIKSLLSSKEVEIKETKSIGCKIYFRKSN